MSTARTVHRAKLMITFAHIASTGSISAAAEHLNLDKGAVSRQLRELEDMLDARLMHRSFRGMTLTEVGALVHERALRVIQEVEDTQVDAQNLRGRPCGVLTVSASVAFGKLHVVPALPAFMQLYPDVEVQLCLLDRHADPVEEGMDVLLRLSDAPPDHLVAHHLRPMDYAVVASPTWLSGGQAVLTPEDLASCHCLFYGFKQRSATWRFTQGGHERSVQVTSRVSVNNSESVRDLALQGVGVALLPGFAIQDDLNSGRLVQLLQDYQVVGHLGRHLYALHLPGRASSPKVSGFVEFARQRWGLPAATTGPGTAPQETLTGESLEEMDPQPSGA